ncbi:MAG TPA: hypothetical protein PLM16_02375 [Candidatus Woesebacteria bacterium]|nr:hypothetical protein [Candidatus Woesebacteria bacterium]
MTDAPRPLILIQGLTATGKSGLAELIAKLAINNKLFQGVVLVGADSRQVYQGLEILSGADLPQKAHTCLPVNSDLVVEETVKINTGQYRYFLHPQLPLEYHGLSIISPDQSWSVAHFLNFAYPVIEQAWLRGYLAIVVGGTGFYHHQLLHPQATLSIKPNLVLRQQAENQSLSDLQKWLTKLNPAKFNSMNYSDQNNPRRLIRAIEIETKFSSRSKSQTNNSREGIFQPNKYFQPSKILKIAPTFDLLQLPLLISKRVNDRFKLGVIDEIKALLKNESLSPLVTSATGFSPLKEYLRDQLSLTNATQIWINQELRYAKRQATWLKKYPPQQWLELKNTDHLTEMVESLLFKLVSN